MSGIVSRLSVLGKVWLGLAAGALALIVFGLAAPGSSLFFPLVSLWCNAALFALALLVLRRAGVELDLFHKAVLVGLWAAAVLYFYWTLGSRTFLYHWDYVNYILKQYHAEAAFAQSTGAGFRFLLDSITEDYTNFITLFTEFPFCLSGKTGDDYILSGIQRTAQPAGAAGGPDGQGGPDATGKEPVLVFPHRLFVVRYLPVRAHVGGAGPAGLVRADFCLHAYAAHTGLPL